MYIHCMPMFVHKKVITGLTFCTIFAFFETSSCSGVGNSGGGGKRTIIFVLSNIVKISCLLGYGTYSDSELSEKGDSEFVGLSSQSVMM